MRRSNSRQPQIDGTAAIGWAAFRRIIVRRTLLQSAAVFSLLLSVSVRSHAEPYSAGGFQGRIALSHDGNFNDEDDWGAFPVAVAILDAFSLTDKLVHVDYCNILSKNDSRFYGEMVESVQSAAERYGIRSSILHNCRTDLDGTIEGIRNAINASSQENPLYYVLAGPMDVPYRGILAADPARRQYVYCISQGDMIEVEVKDDGKERSELDFVQLTYLGLDGAPRRNRSSGQESPPTIPAPR